MLSRATLKSIGPIYKTYQFLRYLTFQPRLAAATLLDWVGGQNSDSDPVPPARLRHRVHGTLDKASFLRVGETVSGDLRGILAKVGREVNSFGRVLDFGCGCGRVLRFLRQDAPSCEFHGTDIDPDLITWCERSIPGVRWGRNGYTPPLSYADGTFDFIYAISVFTHLDESFQRAWLAELARIARPGATLILTVHGESLFSKLGPAQRETLSAKGFLYLTGATGRLKLDGLPDFYQTTFHSREYVSREWSAWFEVLGQFDRAIDGYQDAVLLRKR